MSSLGRLVRVAGLARAFSKAGASAAQQQAAATPFAATGGSVVPSGTPFMRGITTSRLLSQEAAKPAAPQGKPFNFIGAVLGVGVLAGGAFSYTLFTSKMPQQGSLVTGAAPAVKDYAAVRKAIASVMDKDDYDDGSYGPVLVRLAWHAAGTYDKASGTGGSNGATMRFSPECDHGANAGLATARQLLEPIKRQFPWLSYADLWTLAGCVAIEEMGGPHIPWRPGRVDKPDGTHCPPDGRLPDAKQGASHVRDVFGRMGFTDQEAVALVGAHCLGRCHANRSGFDGPWTNAPTTFSNLYFQELKNRTWRKRKWSGPEQYEDKESGKLMMLPADMALLWDRGLRKFVDLYAKDENKFFEDFAPAFAKLMELGVKFPEGVQAV